MSSIDRVSAPMGVAATGTGPSVEADAITRAAVGTLGHRILAWSSAIAGPDAAARAAWSRQVGADGSSFEADAALLARSGDVYGLRQLAADIASRTGATPAEEGRLLRALERVTRAAALLIHGSAGAGEGQVALLAEALEQALAGAAGGPSGIDGVIARLDSTAAILDRQLGL